MMGSHMHKDPWWEKLGFWSQKENLTGFQRPLTVQRVYSDGRTERHYFKVAASLVLISLMKNTFPDSG